MCVAAMPAAHLSWQLRKNNKTFSGFYQICTCRTTFFLALTYFALFKSNLFRGLFLGLFFHLATILHIVFVVAVTAMPADPEPAQGQGVRSDRRAAELAGLAQVQQAVVASRILNVPCRVLCRENDVHEA